MEERSRLHAAVLARPFGKAVALSTLGGALASVGWPATPVGAALLAAGTLVALRAVWRWERTFVLLTPETLAVVHGTLRRRSASVRLGALEVERPLLGRLLGYGTVHAGELEIPYVRLPEY